MKRFLVRAAALLALIAAGVFLAVAAGVVPIAASSGHWPATAWFLHFAMKRSVATHSLSIRAPPLDDPVLVSKGATHYHGGCRACHGSPEQPQPVVARGMTPAPAYLGERIAGWEPQQLFYVVKHGVKFTGMPAWPAQQRDDEVWAVVAFLRRLAALDAAEYRRLALGEDRVWPASAPIGALAGSANPRATLGESCAPCHGWDGLGRNAAFPRLAGQSAGYLSNALAAYARGERHSGIMQPIAASLERETIGELAAHFARLPPAPAQRGDPAAIARGEAIAHEGIPSQRVPSCADCHGPGATPHDGAYPLHAGQHADYLILQLELFARGHRGGSPYARLMRPIAGQLTEEQRRDVAAYYASLDAPSAR